jgi:CheY-like chemotaxis protein
LNLLGNAIKFTESGKVTIRVKEEIEVTLMPEALCLKNKETPLKENSLGESLLKPLNDSEPESIRRIYFEIEDTGIGISKDNLQNLFKLFGKLEQSNSKINQHGVGLGLAISQNLVERLNDHIPGENIRVESQPGRGSKFYFCLLATLSSNAEEDVLFEDLKKIKPQEFVFHNNSKSVSKCDLSETKLMINHYNNNNIDITPKSLSQRNIDNVLKSDQHPNTTSLRAHFSHQERIPLNVLAVDDDQVNLIVIKNYLSKPTAKYDFNLETANNGCQAIELIKKNSNLEGRAFDVVLMDCNMPVMDGYQASKLLSELMKAGEIAVVPIIAITANAATLDRDLCLASGMDSFLSKPLKRVELVTEMDNQITKFSFQRQKPLIK